MNILHFVPRHGKQKNYLDVAFWKNAPGFYLRHARLRAGLSLRALEEISGISHTEIHKVEGGEQDCRMETFTRLCIAVGLQPATIIDCVFTSDFSFFTKQLLAEPRFDELAVSNGIETFILQRYLASYLSCVCAVASHLARCSNPRKLAQEIDYPTEELKRSFLQFADRWSSERESLERLRVNENLRRNPVFELMNQQIEFHSYLTDCAQALKAGQTKKPKPLWVPFVPPLVP